MKFWAKKGCKIECLMGVADYVEISLLVFLREVLYSNSNIKISRNKPDKY